MLVKNCVFFGPNCPNYAQKNMQTKGKNRRKDENDILLFYMILYKHQVYKHMMGNSCEGELSNRS